MTEAHSALVFAVVVVVLVNLFRNLHRSIVNELAYCLMHVSFSVLMVVLTSLLILHGLAVMVWEASGQSAGHLSAVCSDSGAWCAVVADVLSRV